MTARIGSRRLRGGAHLRAALAGVESPDRICVIGLQRTGRSVAGALLAAGISVVAVEEVPDDDKIRAAGELSRIAREVGLVEPPGGGWAGRPEFACHLGPVSEMDPSLVTGIGLVIPSPGVPPGARVLKECASACPRVWSEIELAYRVAEARQRAGEDFDVVAVTGTNGKTTTVRLIEHVLSETGRPAKGCGNIGLPFLDAVLESDEDRALVVEVSSFQLAFCEAFRPDVSVFLNFAPDHLDWHSDLADYAAAKARIFRRQVHGDTAVYNLDDPGVKKIAEAEIGPGVARIPFSRSPGGAGGEGVLVVGEDSVRLPDGTVIEPPAGDARRRRPIPTEDLAASIGASLALGADAREVVAATSTFSPPPHRLDEVARVQGRVFVDDSKATNPHATEAALDAYDSIILIAGGRNKGVDLSGFAGAVADSGRVKQVVCIGETGGELAALLADRGVGVAEATSMEAAVVQAWEASAPGDAILLSPGCASFDWYSNYEERGEDFTRLARLVATREGCVDER